MNTTRLLIRVGLLVALVTGCTSDGATTESYDVVRREFVGVVAQGLNIADTSSMTFEVTDSEIDCVATGTGMSVSELGTALDSDAATSSVDDADTVIFRCFTSNTVRNLFSDALNATGATEAQMTAADIDRGCLLDLVVAAFEQWRATAEPFIALENAFQTILQTEAATCASG